jgi:PAS domain-containing protein
VNIDLEERKLAVTHVHVRARALRDSSGNIEFVGAVTDITERKAAEEASRRNEESFRLIVETIPGLIAVMTPQGEVELVNRGVLDYFGRTLEELKKRGTSKNSTTKINQMRITAWVAKQDR